MTRLAGVNNSTFQREVILADVPVLVDFSADWCLPCRMIVPVLEQLATEHAGTLKIVQLDVDVNRETRNYYGVMSMPTLILFKNGLPVERIAGYQSKARLLSRITPHLGRAVGARSA